MYHKNLLEEALNTLGISYTENDQFFQLTDDLQIIIATPQTRFSFKTKTLKILENEDALTIVFDNNIDFNTQAPFINFTTHKNSLLIRLSHYKF